MIDSHDLAYIAGLLDGEGNIAIHCGKHRRKYGIAMNHALVVRVSSTDLALLEWLKGVAGGRISRTRNKGERRPCYNWAMSGWPANRFLLAVSPYLRMKKAAAQLALEYMRTAGAPRPHGGHPLPVHIAEMREDYRRRLSALSLSAPFCGVQPPSSPLL